MKNIGAKTKGARRNAHDKWKTILMEDNFDWK